MSYIVKLIGVGVPLFHAAWVNTIRENKRHLSSSVFSSAFDSKNDSDIRLS